MDREDEEHHEARGWGESGSSRPEAAGLGLRVGLATWSAAARVRHAWRQGAGRRRQGLPAREQVLGVGSPPSSKRARTAAVGRPRGGYYGTKTSGNNRPTVPDSCSLSASPEQRYLAR